MSRSQAACRLNEMTFADATNVGALPQYLIFLYPCGRACPSPWVPFCRKQYFLPWQTSLNPPHPLCLLFLRLSITLLRFITCVSICCSLLRSISLTRMWPCLQSVMLRFFGSDEGAVCEWRPGVTGSKYCLKQTC